jgi:hypothetical protein
MKRRKAAVLAGVAVMILFMASVVQSGDTVPVNLANLFYEKWAGYQIRYPSGWAIDRPDRVTVLFAGPKNTDDYYTTVTVQNVASAKYGGTHQNVGSLVANLKEQFRKSDPNARFFGEKTFAFTSEEGTPVNAITFSVTYMLKGEKFQQWAVVIPRASDLVYHVFFYTSPARLYERNIKTAYNMLQTLRLVKEGK